MLFIVGKCDFLSFFVSLRVRDSVFDMDICENESPVTVDFNNEMPATELNNEMPATELNNEMPVSGDDMENGEDRHVVNGDSYASQAARTVSYEYPARQERA